MMQFLEITESVIGCAYRVFNNMGYDFLESVYEKCMLIELNKHGLKAEAQKHLVVKYEDKIVGNFTADIVINDVVLVELKSVSKLIPAHEIQLVNYLVATDIDVGLLINFAESGVEVKRKVRTLNS